MLKRHPKQARRGIILMVVLMLITLFAIIGVSFVLYADSEAASARLDRETRSMTRPDLDPQQALGLVLGQIIYGVDDETGVASGLRGHDLARNVYGNYTYYDTSTQRYYALGNSAAFTGNGRLHYTYPTFPGPTPNPAYPIPKWLEGQDDWFLVNYAYFPSDGFLRDPDRYAVRFGLRGSGTDNRGSYLAASGVPYTYPDHNNMALAVIRGSDGAVLAHSFHRPWMGFGSLDPKTNPTNWASTAGPLTKYTLLRPHPSQHPNFPLPEDAGGDVKNFLGGPGYYDPYTQKFCNNDSIWVDPGLPPMTGPDGKQYKIMAAMLIADLGGRIDVNAHGNIKGKDPATLLPKHASDQGFGPWEVNPSLLFSVNSPATYGGQSEYFNLFLGRRNATTSAAEVLGKYGYDPSNPATPTPAAQNPATPGYTPHVYAQVNYDGDQAKAGGVVQYSASPAGTSPFVTFPGTYTNGDTVERTNHPAGYNPVRGFPTLPWTITAATKYNLVFPASDLERLYRFEDTDGPSWASQLERLMPLTFNNPADANCPKRRRLVTTHSSDRNAPGISPYLNVPNPPPAGYQNYSNTSGVSTAGGVPAGSPIPYPTIPAPPGPAPAPTTPPTEFGSDWRTAVASLNMNGSTGQAILNAASQPNILSALRRINLNRSLQQYPLYYDPAASPAGSQTQNTYAIRFDDPAQAARVPQFQQALLDRQNFANDIYRTLLAVTGTPPAANPAAPTDQDLAPRRWLAQLAVNIVDFIDEDDIITPFNFYNTDDGLPSATNIGDPSTNVAGTNVLVNGASVLQSSPRYWVFGTELPHVVLNEALAEVPDVTLTTPSVVNLWLELYNPFQPVPTGATATVQQQDQWAVPLYMAAPAGSTLQPYSPYRIEVWNGGNLTRSGAVVPGTFNDNVLGTGVKAAGAANPADPLTAIDYTEFQTAANTMKTNMPVSTPTGITGSYVPGPVAVGGTNDPTLSFFLLGPTSPVPAGFRDPFVAAGATPAGKVPDQAAVLRNAKLTYTAPFTAGATDERTNGLTILVRRLANPHLPWNNQATFTPAATPSNPTPTPQINPLYNPYVTVDLMDKVPLRDPINATTTPNGYATRGKRQPYAGRTNLNTTLTPQSVYQLTSPNDSPVTDSAVATADATTSVQHTFGTYNNPGSQANASGAPDWLVHLDRQVISPLELLNVSGYQPYQLTRRFVLKDQATVAAGDKFQHLVPWFDPLATGGAGSTSNRLYRLFEFLDSNNRGAGWLTAGRHAGKINLNAIWDFETFQALCDAQTSNHFTATDVQNVWNAFMKVRSPDPSGGANYLPGPVGVTQTPYVDSLNPPLPSTTKYFVLNKPLLPLTTGHSTGDTQNPNPRGIGDTLLQASATSAPLRLFEGANTTTTHPYVRNELLTKIFNNVTTRSNVFAVWITIGFFDYNPTNGQIGAEIGRSEGRNVRHRLFAVVDRSNTLAFSTTTSGAITASKPQQQGTQAGSNAYGMQSVQLTTSPAVAGDPNNAQVVTNLVTGMNWAISTSGQLPPASVAQGLVQPLVLIYEPGTANEETVAATPVAVPIPMTNPPQYTFQLQAAFTKDHAAGVTVQCYGHPGPWKRYDPRVDSNVVLHYSIID